MSKILLLRIRQVKQNEPQQYSLHYHENRHQSLEHKSVSSMNILFKLSASMNDMFLRIMFSSLTQLNIQNFSISLSKNVVSAELAISISSLMIRVIVQECSFYFKFSLGIRVGMKVHRKRIYLQIKILHLCISTDMTKYFANKSKVIPIKCFVSHRPTDPFFSKW